MNNTFNSIGISKRLEENLIANGFTECFEIQRQVIPLLLGNNSRRCIQPRHICASAPTGSGKTLAYVVPLLQALQRDKFAEIRLKAVVILPTRELAQQLEVYDVFRLLSKGLNICVGLASGQLSFEQDQTNLMGLNNTNTKQIFGKSLVDILVCTPGRLQDHLQLTPNFTLMHLRFVVLDEADRLLGNAYHHWVKALVQSTVFSSNMNTTIFNKFENLSTYSKTNLHHTCINSHATNCLPTSFLHRNRHEQSVQRLLFSATLTDNPAKLSLLDVKNPIVIKVGITAVDTDNFLLSESNTNRDTLDDQLDNKVDEMNRERDGFKKTALSIAEQDNTSTLYKISQISQQVKEANDNLMQAKLQLSSQQNQSTNGKFYLPAGLTESICVIDTQRRPLALATLLYEACCCPAVQSAEHPSELDTNQPLSLGNNENSLKKVGKVKHVIKGYCSHDTDMIVIFTSSVETTHKLCVLLQSINNQITDTQDKKNKKQKRDTTIASTSYLFNGQVREMSRSLQADEREDTMTACKSGQVRVLVSTDQMARGIDLPNIKLVINYDCPSEVKTYLHRVGRTARGSNQGHAITMLKIGQTNQFRQLHEVVIPSAAQQKHFPIDLPADTFLMLRSVPDHEIEDQVISEPYKMSLTKLPEILEDDSERFVYHYD